MPPEEPVPPEEPEPEAQPEPARPAADTVLLRVQAELDDAPGLDPIELRADGTLVAGAATGRAELTGASDFWMHEQSSLTVVELDRRRHLRAVLVGLPIAEDEDPPNRYQLFLLEPGGLRRVLDLSPGAYGVTSLVFSGDGSVRYTEDGWTACARAGHPSRPVAREEVSLRMRGGEMREAGRRRTSLRQNCDELAACPVVYVVGAAGEVRVGEILRDLRGAAADALQGLDLAAPSGSEVRVRLSEEEHEVTRLDEIYLDVDGVRIESRGCAGARSPWCEAGGDRLSLREGDALELVFELPEDARVLTLFARGHYVPTPTGDLSGAARWGVVESPGDARVEAR